MTDEPKIPLEIEALTSDLSDLLKNGAVSISSKDYEDLKVKAEKFEKIRDGLWDTAQNGNNFAQIMTAQIIRAFDIEGPNGEDPEGA